MGNDRKPIKNGWKIELDVFPCSDRPQKISWPEKNRKSFRNSFWKIFEKFFKKFFRNFFEIISKFFFQFFFFFFFWWGWGIIRKKNFFQKKKFVFKFEIMIG